MATEAYISEFISITKEGEEKNLTRVQLDATADENNPGELKNVEGALNDPPEIFEYSEKTENMKVAIDIGIETVSTVNKGNAGTSEGENFFESPSVSKVAHEETGRVSEDYQAGEIPNQAEKEIFREETKLQKYQKLEGTKEIGKVENEGMEEIREGEEKVSKELGDTTSQTNPPPIQRELGETGFGGGKDKESEKSSILMGKENDPEAEEIEHESDEGEKIPYVGTGDVTITTAAASIDETTLQEAGITFKEKSQDTIVLSEKMKDVTPVEGEIQDKNRLHTPLVTQTEDLGLQKADKPEALKEVSETGTEDISMKEIPDDKILPQVDLNEKIESEEDEILNKNSNELLVSYPSVEETVLVEGAKLDGIPKFESQEQVHETNGDSIEEKKHFEEVTEAYKSAETLILEPTSIEGEKASKTYAEAIDFGLDTEEESKEKRAGQNIEEEIQKKEEACEPEINKCATKSNDTEKGIIEDVSAKVSDTACIGNETIQKSLQVDYLDQVPSALTSEGKSNKAEDDDEKDNIIPEEVHDEVKITGATEGTRELIVEEDNVTEGSPESIEEETVKIFLDNEKILLADEKSRGEDSKEQTIVDRVKGTPESIKEENFTDNEKQDEKCKEEIFELSEMARAGKCVESEKILNTSMVKPKESLQGEGENQVPIEASTEEKRDEHRYSVMDEDNDDNTGIDEVKYSGKEESSKGEENAEWIPQKNEAGEKLEQSLNVMSKVTEAINSSEYIEKITCIEEERAIQDIEETFEKEESKDTKDSEERGTANEEDLKPIAVASEMSISTESTVLELKSEKGEMEVEKLEKGNELGSEERFKGNDAREDTVEEIKKEETYDADLHKVEITCDDTEKSKIEEDALIKDGSTVWIGEETVELSCQEDGDGQNGTEKAALKLNGGDYSVRKDNETENSTDQIISKEIATISEGTEKHTIKEEHTTIGVSPQSSGEETHKSSQEDETKEEGEKPIVEMCEELETTTVGEGIEGQILEGNTIQDHFTVPTEVEETEDISKDNDMMAKTPKPEVSEISQRYDGVEDIQKDNFKIAVGEETNKEGSPVEEKEEELDREVCETIGACQDHPTEFIEKEKDTENPQEDRVCQGSEIAVANMETEKQEIDIHAIPDLSFSSFGGEIVKESSAQDFEGSIKECVEVEKVAVELDTEAQRHGSEASDTKNNSDPTEENKNSVDAGEKLEGAPESVAEDQNNETLLEMNQTQIKESRNNVQDQKSESVEEQNIEQGLQEDENTYEETASRLDATDHINEIQNANETTSERTVDISHTISEESEEINKEIIQEAETCYNKLDTASEKVETEETSSWEPQLDEKPLKGTETSSEEKTLQTTAKTSPQDEEGTIELMSQLPAIAGENADKESGIVEKSHVDEVEKTKGDSKTVSESREQCVDETDKTQKSLTVEELEGIIKEEIKGPSETVSECNYKGFEAVIEDEINVVQTVTARKSEQQHQETSTALLSKEWDHGITAAIGYSDDGIAKEDETPQNEDLEDSFATKTEEEACSQKEEPREIEISGLGLEVDEDAQKDNPNEPPKEEFSTKDEVSQLEPQENVSAIKCSDSPTESDKVMELSEEVPEGAEKAAEESEEIKEMIIEKERDVKEYPAVSIEDESVNEEQYSETVPSENLTATDPNMQTEKLNLEMVEDVSKDPEASLITKAMEKEMLQKQGSEKKVDVSSSVSEISEEINKEVIEDADTCSNNIDTASEKVETEETSLQEAQLDDKHINIIETSSEDTTLQTNTTTETCPQGEEVDSILLEETPEGVSQHPAIACENTDKESEIMEKPHVDEVEEIKGASETVSESREQCVEENDGTHKSLTMEESQEGLIKEEIKGPSETVSGCNYEGIEAVIEDEIDVVQTVIAGKSEQQHPETSTTLLSEEQDHGITAAIGYSEDGIAKEDETPQNEDLEDSFVTKTEEVCSQKEEPRELEISGLGLVVDEDVLKNNLKEPPKEECSTRDEVSQLEPQENVSAIKCSDSPTESDKVMELSEEVPEGAEKAAEESENIKELIIEKETNIKEFPAVSIEDESVNEEQYAETVPSENLTATDSNMQTEKLNLEMVEDVSKDPEASLITKAMEEEMLQKQGSEKKVDVSSSISAISEEINKEVIEDADTCSNNIDTASEKVETEETSLQEAQLDDKHINIIETSSEDTTLQTNTTTETCLQGEEVDSIMREETSEGVSQHPAIVCENTDKESEILEKPHVDEVEEIKGASETVSESREQCVEENDGTQKNPTVGESQEGLIKEEIKGPSETVSGCNYEGVEAVIEDEIDFVQTVTTGKSEEQHQETSTALLSKEWDHGITAAIGYPNDGIAKEDETPQNEDLEDSFATKTEEEVCSQKEEPREIEISGLGLEVDEDAQKDNPNEPPKEEFSTRDEVSQLEPQENVSAIKCSDSPKESDKVMELSEEVPEGAEKAAEESENIKGLIIEKERDIQEFPAVSTEDESVNEERHSKTVSDENPRATNSEVQTQKVNIEVVEDFSKDPEASLITKAMQEEMLQKQGSEKKVDISSSVSEISEEINKEVIEDVDTCSNNIDTASEKEETEETSLQEAQLDDKHINIIETSSEDKTLQTNTTTETCPQGEEVDSIMLEETSEGVSQHPAIACENTDKESEIVEKPHVDEVEEIKGAFEMVSESREQCVEENDGMHKSLTVEEKQEGLIKEEIKGPSETVFGCNYEGVEAVIEDEINVVQTVTAGKSEQQHPQTSTALLSKEQDHGITAAIGYSEDGIAKEDETPQNEDLEDSFATKTEEEVCSQKEEPREIEISGLGLEVDEDAQKDNPNEPPKEEFSTRDEVSQLEPQENVSAIKCSDSPKESDKVMELSEEVPEEAEKAAEESENIKELIIEKDRDIKELPTVSIEDESVNEEQHSKTVSDENPRATDSEVQTQKVNIEVVEDFNKDPEGSPITKAMEEEMLQKQDSEKKVDVCSSVSEISEEINKEVIEDMDTCSNNIDTASEKVETEETSLQEAQLDDKHINIIETSSEDKTLQTNTTTETCPQGEEVDSIMLEETSEGVSQHPAIACENTDKESEIVEKPHVDEVEEIKGASETVSESREQCVEENDETHKSLTMEESQEGLIKEEIKGPSETVSGCNYEGVEAVIEDEIDVVQTATAGKSEKQHPETSTTLLSEEQDHGITAAIGYSEDGIAKEECRKLEISGLGLEVDEDVQKNNPNEPLKEECSTPDEVSQLEPRENGFEIKGTDSPVESDKIIELTRSIDSTLQEASMDDENLDSRISNNRADDDLLPHLAGEEILQEVDENCNKTSNIECENFEKASDAVFEVHSNVVEKAAVKLEAGAYNHGSEASSLKNNDSLTEEAPEEAEKAAESQNIKKLITEKEGDIEEPAAVSIEDESANKVQHSDTVPSENLRAADPNIQTEKVNLDVVEDFSQGPEGTPIEKALEEEMPQVQGSEKTVDVSSSVSEISAETAKQVIEEADACYDKLDTASEKAETEEASLQEAQLNDNHIKIIKTSSEDKKLQTNTTMETSPQNEEVDSVKLEETSMLVSQLQTIACENADKESETVEKATRDEVEETKGATDTESDSKVQWAEAIDETQKNPTVEESKEDIFTEEIKGPSETVSESNYQGVEAIIEEKITVVETATSGKSEKQHQETPAASLSEEQDHGISITIGYSEDGKTKEDETPQNENLEDSFDTKTADDMRLQKEEPRELEISGLGLELNENIQKNNPNEPPKEECSTIEEVSSLEPQENVSVIKCTDSPVESDKVMELTEEVPEGAEKAAERENIKELIIEKGRDIKDLPAVSIDESVIKVQVLEPVSSENLGVTDPNMQMENLNLEVEDSSKEPEGSPITKALEEEMSEKQDGEKAMDVPSSVSEMQEENINREIMEKADISYSKLDTTSEKGETEESSSQEAELDDKPPKIIETISEDKTLQTNTITETSPQAEEVDSVKLEETLELVSQLPANACENTNKESETVEKPNADEIEETAGASDTVSESKEQCAEEIDETQKSLTLEKSEEGIIKEQIKGASEMESASKYQGVEAVIEEEITAGQAIKAEKPEEQLEEVSTAILSGEQEHGINTIIGRSEDENIKEGETPQYENPGDPFGTKMPENICLQKEEPRELDVSGLGLEIHEDVPKEDGNRVDGVSQYELQENASELKCTDSSLGSEKVMEQTRSINSTKQEATKDDENLDSGIFNNNPDVLTHSPGEEILQEVGENCEEASNLECENFEKASEPVSDLQSTEIDEAVVGLEVGAHIHGSDTSNTKNSENLIEEVPQGAEKAVESENIKEPIIEKERDIKELPAVSIEDETVNKVQHTEAVSNENIRATDSNMQAERMNSEVAEYLSKDPEGSPISEALREEMSQKQASEKTEEVTISVSEMSEESFKEETIKEADTCCSKLDTAPEKVVTEEMSLQEVQLDDKPLKGIETSAAEKTLPTNTTTESSLQGEEVDSMKVEETSELMSRLPTIACESAHKEGKIVEKPHADEVEEPKGPSDTVSESREQSVEKIVETRESLTLEKSEENIVKEEIKGPSDTVSECTYQSFEAVIEDEITADQTIEAEKPEEQLREMSTALVSEEQENGISTITMKLEDETPQYENQEGSFGTKMTEERCLHKEESRELEVSKLELDDDVQKKPSNEEPKEGGNALYGITPLEPQEDAFEIKCTDSLAESDMELTRSMDSTLQEASKDYEDLASGISIKNVDDVLPHHSSGEEILQEVDENCEEASNLEGEKIEKASESMSQVHSAEVDKAAIEFEAGSHSHGSEASSTENNNNLTEKNIELADLGEKLGGGPELVAEDECNQTLPKTNQTQVNENSSSAWEQNTKSMEEQIIGQRFQEHEKETIEETESKLESRDHINVIQNESETTKDVASVEELPGGSEKAEEKENIQEQTIEEKRDIKELPAVSIEDETVNKVQYSEPVSCESFRATESNQETKEVNLEDEEDPCEKPADVSSSVFEPSEQGVKGEIIDEADNYNKLDTASEKVEAEKTVLQEPQLDDEPLKGIETILEEKTPPIINTTEISPGDEEGEAVKLEKTADLVSQLPTTTYEHADKESVIVEKPQADEVDKTKRASDTVSESKDHCGEEIDETQRSLTMEKLEEEIIEEEITGRSRTVSACNQGVEAIIQDEITKDSPKAGNPEEQLWEMSTALLSEEKENEITTTIGKSEAENKRETPQKENLEDSLGTESVEEISLQKEGLRKLEVSALAPKLSNVIQKESPNEVLKEEGEPQENVSDIKYMDSITGSEEVKKLTRSIDSSSQEASKEKEILDLGSSNNKADDFSITHSSVEILQQMQERCEKTPNLESEKIEKVSESVSEVHYPEVLIKIEEPEVKEEHLKTSTTEMRAEEIPHEKTIEANEIITNEISNEEIAEEKQVAEDCQPQSLDEETIRKSQQEDELKNEVEHEELYEESKKGEASENIEKQIIDEARTIEHPHLVSFRDESVKDNLPEEAKGERNDKETDIKLDLVNQSDETTLSEQADCSDIQLVKKDLDTADTNEDKEIVITKDEDLKPNLDVLPATSAAAEEASHQKEGDRIGEVSESFPQEPVHEATRRNEEIATAITDNSEIVMEDKMHIHTPRQLVCNEYDVLEGLNLKDPEVDTNENGTSPLSETSWEEIPDKESVISEEERQHDLTSGKQTIAESKPTEEKGAKDEVEHAKDEGEHTTNEEPIEFSARGSEGKLEEAEIHSTKCNEDGEIQDQIEKINSSSQVQYSCMEISEKEVSMDLAEANESAQDIKQLEKGSDETSEKHIPREAEPNGSTEVAISSGKEDVQLVPQDPLRKTFQQPEVESLEAVNVSGVESGVREIDSGGDKTMGDISEEPAADSTPMGPAVSLSDLLQRSVKETLQASGCLTEEKEPMAHEEDVLAKEEEAIKVQEAGTHEDRDEEEEGDEYKKEDSGSDAPVIVEASRDMNVKDGHKKSHSILSGVGSKVKHSIAKVKKAITGKSSHQKHSSPKGTASKVKEQK